LTLHNCIYLHPTAGQLSINGGLWGNWLLFMVSHDHGRWEAVAPRWASKWEIKRIDVLGSSTFNTPMMSHFLKERRMKR